MNRKRGRNRNANVAREPNGRPQRTPEIIIPHAALAQRAALLGIDVDALIRHGFEAVAAICRDQGAGTALGRMTWKTGNDGSRERRMGDFGGREPEEWITSDMEAAAEEYRTLWVRWYRMVGLPRRHPQGMTLERHDKGLEVDTTTDEAARKVIERMAAADAVLLGCRQPRLVMAVIDGVLIDNIAPEGLVLGERSVALVALRRGLDALAHVLLRGRRQRAA